MPQPMPSTAFPLRSLLAKPPLLAEGHPCGPEALPAVHSGFPRAAAAHGSGFGLDYLGLARLAFGGSLDPEHEGRAEQQ